MKIAVPSRDGRVDDHFGNCAYYSIVETNDDGEVVGYSTLESPEGCGCKSNIAGTLREMGVGVMLAGNMGQGAVNKLTESGIEVVRGCSGEVIDVIFDYMEGRIADNAQVCDHHDCTNH